MTDNDLTSYLSWLGQTAPQAPAATQQAPNAQSYLQWLVQPAVQANSAFGGGRSGMSGLGSALSSVTGIGGGTASAGGAGMLASL